MLCTADTTTSLDIAIALYYMLCTTDTATCVGTAITLYYMLCTAGTLTYVGTTIVLYCMLYAMHVLSTCVCTATALYIYSPILSAAEHLQALPLVHIIIVCLHCYFIPVDRATTCMVLPSLYYIICPRYCTIKVWNFIMMNNATHMVLYAIIAGLAYHLFIQNACGTCVPVLVTVYIICTYVCCWHPTVF